jgi:phage terminase large subunit-like protein
VPKKNGKSELASALALYLVCGDDEQGGEVYSAAGDREQASLVYFPATKMVENNRILKKRLKVLDSRKRIIDFESNSFYQVLSSETYTKHGLNPSAVIIDELHAQPTRDLYDVLTEGTNIARDQQMVIIITTAGIADKNSIGWEVHEYARQVANGVIHDPGFLPIMYCIGEDEDWENAEVWRKVNPSLDFIFDFDNIQKHYEEIKANPLRLNNFLRYRLNKWVRQEIRWLSLAHWDACAGNYPLTSKEEKETFIQWLKGRICFAGLDLSSTTDITALVLVFPFDNGGYAVLPHFWIPQDNILERVKKDRVPYDLWQSMGMIDATPGNVIDYAYVIDTIQKYAKLFDLREIAFDRWGSTKIVQDLQALGFEDEDNKHVRKHLISFGQGFASMSNPSKELLKLVMSHKLMHGGHPVMRWMADNLVVVQDPAENVKPDKGKATERIDGCVALIMGLDRAISGKPKKSKYETEEMITL